LIGSVYLAHEAKMLLELFDFSPTRLTEVVTWKVRNENWLKCKKIWL